MNKKFLFVILLIPYALFCGVGAQTFTVTNTNDSGPGSFREAVEHFNNGYKEDDKVEFELTGVGPFYIHLLSDLKISREHGMILSTVPVTIRGQGLLLRQYESTLIGNLNWIRRPKSLRDIAVIKVASQIISKKIELEAVLVRLPVDLHEMMDSEYEKQKCEQNRIDLYTGPWDLQIHSGLSMPLIWGPSPAYWNYKD